MKTVLNSIQSFFKMEQSGGIVLFFAIAAAMLCVAFEPTKEIYSALSHSHFSFELVGLSILDKDFHYFVNDGLMAIFFLLIGLEVKREFVAGELSDPANVVLPGLAALGGLLVPCAIYYYFNQGLPTESGWAVPAATDIAIAFGVLAILGSRVPNSLKTFLLMLAIFDDVMVVGIIAVFFTETIAMNYLIAAVVCAMVLAVMCKKNVSNFAPFAIVGFILWYCTLKSGVHATIAGIVLAMFIPMKERKEIDDHTGKERTRPSMLTEIEHSLHEFVSFGVLPLFAFINSGIALSVADFQGLTSPESLGIILGLFVGKQIGVFGVAYVLIKSGLAKMPTGANFIQIYGVAILCGIGFTMGLFIGDLAFKGLDVAFKLPILVGSTLSAVVGLTLVAIGTRKKEDKPTS